MDLTQVYDPELLSGLQAFPTASMVNWDDLPAARTFGEQMLAQLSASIPDSPRVAKEDRAVPGPEGTPEVPIRIYRPVDGPSPLPGLFWIHGGGYVLGSIQQDDLMMQHIVEAVGCLIVSVEYRLAPEHPFPAPVEDCYAALQWMAHHTAGLGVDPSRIAVGGASAGGGLAAGLVLLARDRGEVAVAFQLLIYPMIDDRDATASSEAFADAPIWNRQANRNGWRAYLGDAAGGTTLAYDHSAILGEDGSVPTKRAASVSKPALVMYGSASYAFMHDTARTLSQAMPHAHLHALEGQRHEVSPEALAPVLVEFFAE
jgi:acetyl esterase/lipase